MVIQCNAQSQDSVCFSSFEYSRMELVNCGSGGTRRVLPQTLDVMRCPPSIDGLTLKSTVLPRDLELC